MKHIGLRAFARGISIGFVVAIMGLGSSTRAATIEELRAAELQKVEAETEIEALNFLGLLAGGGPDTFGYTWIDSDEPGGPAFDWVDITAVGTPVPFSSYVDDGNVGPLPLGFDFPFYGNSFSQLFAASNGWMSFTNGTLTTYTNQSLPNSASSVPENLLAPWWDDMVYDESDGNYAYYYDDGSRFIITYYVRRIVAFTPPFYEFQVILYPNGNIVYQYNGLGTTLNSSTIGIQNGTKDDGLTVVHNDGTYAHEELAILFTPPIEVVEVAIDIKPGGDPNSITCTNENGVIAVAILSTEDFDATTVDQTTVIFEGASETHVDQQTGAPLRHEEDVDDDGDIDLVFHFRLGDTNLTCDSTEGTLTGETFDGQSIQGVDSVRLVKTHR